MNKKIECSPTVAGSLNRRQFLRGAAGAVGASVVGLAPAGALAQALGGGLGSTAVLSVGYWNGQELVPASSVAAGDATLENIALTIDGRAAGSAFDSIAVQFFTNSGQISYPAWYTSPSGCSNVSLSTPVSNQKGFTFTTHFYSGTKLAVVDTKLALGAGSGAKLLEGIYVVVPGLVNWTNFPFNPNSIGSGIKGPNYVVITVSRL